MKKRLMIGFLGATFLFVLLVSNDNDIIQRVTPHLTIKQTVNSADDTSCYKEPSTPDGIEELDYSGGDGFTYLI